VNQAGQHSAIGRQMEKRSPGRYTVTVGDQPCGGSLRSETIRQRREITSTQPRARTTG
jgi:hypothetical protein